MTTRTELIHTYFARAAGPDMDAYLKLFTEGSIVEDESHQHRGLEAIRTWRSSTVPVRYELLNDPTNNHTDTDRDWTTSPVRISGEFPGSPVVLIFRFLFDDDGRITSLTIRQEMTS